MCESFDQFVMAMLRVLATFFFFVLNVVLFIIGLFILTYVAWILATTDNERFLQGRMVFTYGLIAIGVLWTITGVTGWLSTCTRPNCILPFYLCVATIMIVGELGGIITLTALKIKMTDLVKMSWYETNPPMQHYVQYSFRCCGFKGPQEYANEAVMDVSCFRLHGDADDDRLIKNMRRAKTAGCREKLMEFMHVKKFTWIIGLGTTLLLQMACALLCVFLMSEYNGRRKRQRNRDQRTSSFSSLTHSHKSFPGSF